MPKSLPLFITAAMAFGLGSAMAEEDSSNVVFSTPTVNVFQEVDRVVKGGTYIKATSPDGLSKSWIEPTGGAIDFKIKKEDRLGLEVMVAATYFSAPYHYDQVQNYTRNISVSAPRLDASYVFGDVSQPLLRVDFGILNYKYNEYSRDLGEYMFRSWAYPGIIQTGGAFGYLGNNSATITGLKLSQTLGMFSHDFIVSLETDMTPVYDLNLTYMFKANFHDVLKVGGGVQLGRIYSADKDPLMTVHYFQHNGVWYAADAQGAGYYQALQQGIQDKLADPTTPAGDLPRLNNELAQTNMALGVLDSVNSGLLAPQMKDLTAQSIKPLLYFSFDPKPLLGSEILGSKDLVLYGEAEILGIKNYPVYYQEMMRRIPMMIGFNIPTFKVLDVLSLEMEYYRSQWLPTYPVPNSLNGTPNPYMALSSYYPTDWDKDNFKWSVYADRTLFHGITLSAQFASDHSRSWDWNVFGKTPWEIYTSPSQWYWGLKLGMKI